MPKYNVKVAVTYEKYLNVYAANEKVAAMKAKEIVNTWANVEDVETVEVTEAVGLT